MELQIKLDQEYTLTLTGQEVIYLNEAISELKAKIANPLSDKIGKQLQEQSE